MFAVEKIQVRGLAKSIEFRVMALGQLRGIEARWIGEPTWNLIVKEGANLRPIEKYRLAESICGDLNGTGHPSSKGEIVRLRNLWDELLDEFQH